MSIANALIDLGLNQVAIFREPIHNSVAQIFFIKFLSSLIQEKNVSNAVWESCQFLKDNKNLEYPSAYLIPSLFCHPSATFYKIEPMGWQSTFKRWLPNSQQAIVLSSLILLSLLPYLQEFLLDLRTVTQAIYRDITSQYPPNSTPPVLLISIDEESFNRENITERNPLNRKYLAKIIDQLSTLNTKIIGIDYLLNIPQGQNDQILAQSIQNVKKKPNTSLIFASLPKGEKEIGISPDIASLKSVMQGTITSPIHYLDLPNDCTNFCPFGYLIAVNQALLDNGITFPQFNNTNNYKIEIFNFLTKTQTDDPLLNFLKTVQLHPITQVSEYFQQRWLQPITDFSLPPEIIYKKLPAWQLLEEKKLISNQVVLIASGGYSEAGIDGDKDVFAPPLAYIFWQNSDSEITGGEIHAYMIHHWLTRHIIIPIPELWMLLIAALFAQAISLKIESYSLQIKGLILKLILVNLLYILISLQIYISFKIVFSWFLPSLAFWLYILPSLRKTFYEK